MPRPMGLTAMSIEYQKTNDEGLLNKIYNYLISQWFMGSGTLCGISYDINGLSKRFNIDPVFIKTFIRDSVLNSRIWSSNNQQELLDGLLSEQLTWAIEDRMEVLQQVNILKESQNGKYTPFISAELNKALKLRLDSSASLQTIIKNLTGGGTTNNIFNQFNNVDNHTEQNITIEQARSLIEESMSKLPQSDNVKLLDTKYDIEALPVVVATDQTGIDTSKEGIGSLNKVELNAIVDNYKGAIEVSSKEHHELRREIEENIDPDEEDPELDIYNEDPEEDNVDLFKDLSEKTYNSLDSYLS